MTDSGIDDDALLVRSAQIGSIEAYDLLYRRYSHAVRQHLIALKCDVDLADDLTQDTFMEAFRHLDRVDPRRPILPWFLHVAHDRWRMHQRQQERQLRYIQAWWLKYAPSRPVWPSERVEKALAKVPDTLRAALLLVDRDGLSSAEAAAKLKTSPVAIRQRVSRARRIFRKAYDEESGDTHDLST